MRALRHTTNTRSADGAKKHLVLVCYGTYALVVSAVIALLLWPFVVLWPGSWRRRYFAARFGAKCVQRLTRVPFTVVGAMPDRRPLVIVANHESFVDGAVLILALDEPMIFIVGSVFADKPLIGRFLSHLGSVFAGGGTPHTATVLTHRLVSLLGSGVSVASFPEGGLAPSPGLRTFHLGAFAAAAEAGAMIVPVGISGTRSVVPPGERFPRRGAILVQIGAPIAPTGSDWRSVVALRNLARTAVADLSDEPTSSTGAPQ
ncbi:MAG: lysophospholipid acyltransferase family protein [Acidimicrobiales bacterium]